MSDTVSRTTAITAINFALMFDGQAEMHGRPMKTWKESVVEDQEAEAYLKIAPEVEKVFEAFDENQRSSIGYDVILGEITGGYLVFNNGDNIELSKSPEDIATEIVERFF